MKKLSKDDKVTYIKTAFILGCATIIFLTWLWWVQIYLSKSNVFNAMLSNNLSTRGMTKHQSEKTEGGSFAQVSQAQFGASNLVASKVDITQPGDGGEIKVTTRSITTPNEDYMSYASINVPTQEGKPKIDFNSLYGQWARTSSMEGGGSGFSEFAYNILMFGNLPKEQRDELLSIIRSESVYKTDFNKTDVVKENGRTIYKYKTEVNPKGYGKLVKKYDEMLGRKQMVTLDPEQYANMPPINVEIKVDEISRTLVGLSYSEGKSENYNGFGSHRDIDLPDNPITRQDLESKLQELLKTQQ